MGCDIHAHIEYKELGDPVFSWFTSPHLGQDYLLFALLANVRKQWVAEHLGFEVEALFAPRGLPNDMSYNTKRGHNGCADWNPDTRTWELEESYFGRSWLSTEEFRIVLEAYFHTLEDSIENYKAQHGVEWGVELRATLKAMEVLPNARLVFWFDN